MPHGRPGVPCHAASAPPRDRQSCQAQLSQSVQCRDPTPPQPPRDPALPCPALPGAGILGDTAGWGDSRLTNLASSFSLGKAECSQLGPHELFACWEAKTSHFQSASHSQGRAPSPGKWLAELAREAAPCPPHTHLAVPEPPASTSGRGTMLKPVSEREKGH